MDRPIGHNFKDWQGAGGAWLLAAVLVLTGVARGAGAPSSQESRGSNAAVQGPQNWFGVAVENLQPGVAEQLKLQAEQGVVVVTVFPGSPAEKAGILPKDFLIEINGKPLTSQEDLAKAANAIVQTKGGPSAPTSEVIYLRKGERRSAQVQPASRPAEMRANFNEPAALLNEAPAGRQQQQFRNFNLSNGNSVQVGPGVRIDARQKEDLNIIRQAAVDGNSIILTTERDAAGNIIRNTVNDGKNTYVVDPNDLQTVPQNLRPLVERSFNQYQATNSGIGQAGLNQSNNDRNRNQAVTMDDRLRRLEQQNADLKRELEEVKKLLLKRDSPSGPSAESNPTTR